MSKQSRALDYRFAKLARKFETRLAKIVAKYTGDERTSRIAKVESAWENLTRNLLTQP